MALLNDDRIIGQGGLARALYDHIRALPIISPHGHCDPAWFAGDAPFADPASLLVTPDHYLLRMLVSQGVRLEDMGVPRRDGTMVEDDPRRIWHRFAGHYHLFRGTPSRLWLDHTFATLFDMTDPLGPDTADLYFDHIAACLAAPAYRPRALFDRFNIAALATTDGALDGLDHHRAIATSGWDGRVIPTYRPDLICDPEQAGFHDALDILATQTGCDTGTWAGYLEAHRIRRAVFRAHGATATDHGVAAPDTANLPPAQASALYDRIHSAPATPADAALFRAQMLTEMAQMSVEDGLTMQLHTGSFRNHNAAVFADFGRDRGFDIPVRVDWVRGLKPLLDAVGMEPGLTLILFTLDEGAYARELAPLAGAYPCLRLGPPWWFHDSPEGMMRFRRQVTETAGFYNTVGFNDDTRAFPSIPARHDMARRVDARFLAGQVTDGLLREAEAFDLALELTDTLPRRAYGLGAA
jgi:glucuronate isomerase